MTRAVEQHAGHFRRQAASAVVLQKPQDVPERFDQPFEGERLDIVPDRDNDVTLATVGHYQSRSIEHSSFGASLVGNAAPTVVLTQFDRQHLGRLHLPVEEFDDASEFRGHAVGQAFAPGRRRDTDAAGQGPPPWSLDPPRDSESRR